MARLAKRARSNRREELLLTAARLFKTYGYHGTSMQQLADAIGLGKGSLYHHMVSKEELVHEIMTSGVADAISKADAILADDGLPPVEKLRTAIRVLIRDVCEDFDASLGLVVMSDGHILSPDLRAEYVALRDEYEDRFESIIKLGIESGDFEPCDTGLATKTVLGMCAWVVFWFRPGGRLTPEEIAREVARVCLKGLSAN